MRTEKTCLEHWLVSVGTWSGQHRRGLLRAYRESEEMVLGDHLGVGWPFLLGAVALVA